MKFKRRPFLKVSARLMSLVGLTSLSTMSNANPFNDISSDSKNFVHHVFFWLKEPDNAEEKKRFEKGLKKLLSIKEIKQHYIGRAADTDREVIDNTYDYSLLLIFESKKKQDIYQEHPTHLEFIEDHSNLWEKVLVYDSVDI